MKNFLITPTIIIALFLFSCNKEKRLTPEPIPSEKKTYTDQNDYSQLTIKDNLLEFTSFEYYKSFMGAKDERKTDFLIQKIRQSNFNSYEKLMQTKSSKNSIDDFIVNILNQDNIVKIDQWYLKLNFETEKVYAVPAETTNAYQLAANEKTTNGSVYEFSFEDEVITLLEEGQYQGQSTFCSDRRASSRSHLTPVHRIITHGNIYVNGELRSDYKRYGVYFTLISEGALVSNDLNFNSKTTMWFYLSNCSYEIRCGGSQTGRTYPTNYPTYFNVVNSSTVIGRYRWYGGSKQLKSYDYKVKMRIDHTYTTTPPNSFTPTYSYWTHIANS
ncbi:MAG: hypothetical protein N4A35_16025 [Flavobacteriales bacterium]|jgi:hypothetical protein|nr:hypothetical protein [Flavobacteriales bacterium]